MRYARKQETDRATANSRCEVTIHKNMIKKNYERKEKTIEKKRRDDNTG